MESHRELADCTSALDMLAPWLETPPTTVVDYATLRRLLLEHSAQHPEHVDVIRSTLLTLALLPDIYLQLPTNSRTEQLQVLDQLFPSAWADTMRGSAGTAKSSEGWPMLLRNKMYEALFTEQAIEQKHATGGWRDDTHWLRLLCMWTGWLGEPLPEHGVPHLLERCTRSWSEKYDDMVVCALLLSAHQLMALAKERSQHIYQSIKSTGRSRVALALAARYSSVDTAFVRQLLQQTLHIAMPMNRANFMAFGQMISDSQQAGHAATAQAPLTVDDIQQLTHTIRHLPKGQKLDYFDQIVIDVLNSGLGQDTRVRVNSVVPDYLPSLLVNPTTQKTSTQEADGHPAEHEDTIVIALLLLLLIMESAEKRRQFDALYASGQLLEQVDATWWLTQRTYTSIGITTMADAPTTGSAARRDVPRRAATSGASILYTTTELGIIRRGARPSLEGSIIIVIVIAMHRIY
ncbi:hypothetical protein SYNPS1DRAFT_29417 [Syncephalis pseudoplumigaleata]|uniref:Uncharacterized protein n=1 Tax=Syncephalis pseudoplumigaleata TaxID=1712513 RepID=A0A4P9YZ24_9FUNG|nr:hypothetical protein SYNPS1DRAFT_29417 [Syncephalis pseudoplumigaleata]|eukprot:RKP24832.1 hypothetical protein SYNPS1DRAFT_29417 [Syncephalis pseudoplumigaleata]